MMLVVIVHQVFWIETEGPSIISSFQGSGTVRFLSPFLCVLRRPRESLDVLRARSWIHGFDGNGTWR